jgi:hypothetical protein
MGPRLHSAAENGQRFAFVDASSLVAAAETAAVRSSVISRPFMTASGSPVSARKTTMIAR